jgi:site-specific recombinase XerD
LFGCRFERSVPVGASWLRLYADYLHEEDGALDSDYVFMALWSQPRGQPLSYGAVSDLFSQLRRNTGIAVTPHMFRHTYATGLLRKGVKVETVSKCGIGPLTT